MSLVDSVSFPIDLSKFHEINIDPFAVKELPEDVKEKLMENIQLCRDAIVFFTCTGAASGYGGHTGGAFDTVPEVCLLEAFFNGSEKFVPVMYDEAGHRVATQYLRSALKGKLPAEQLMKYRVGHSKLPGHPELGLTEGVEFSSGRLGHMWPFLNGVALADRSKLVVCLGSDGSQMEGNNAEAARLAVANNLNVKLFVDDNNVTIAGHPTDYMKGFDVGKTLEGHGMRIFRCTEDLTELYAAMRDCVMCEGPAAVVIQRPMAPGIPNVEGTCKGHDVVPIVAGKAYLEKRGLFECVKILDSISPATDSYTYLAAGAKKANRVCFGEECVRLMGELDDESRKRRIMVIDNDLEGSTGIKKIHEVYPENFILGGIMERGNISAAAGFGQGDRQGIYATFCAFLEMCCSEITMARLNNSNVLCHFSHSGVDDMADNTCHFGLNAFFADNGIEEHNTTRLYFPADAGQLRGVMNRIFWEKGMRFLFSTRSKVPQILKENGDLFYGPDYVFDASKDDVIREGSAGYVVSFGDALYRALDAVERVRASGLDVGLINKCALNVVDEEMMAKLKSAPFVLLVEPLSKLTGLGIRFGTWLLVRGATCKYDHIGVALEGCGGLFEHAYHQGYDPKSIMDKVYFMAEHPAPKKQKSVSA